MAAGEEGTCKHNGTDVDGDGGTHAITGRTTGTQKLTTDEKMLTNGTRTTTMFRLLISEKKLAWKHSA